MGNIQGSFRTRKITVTELPEVKFATILLVVVSAVAAFLDPTATASDGAPATAPASTQPGLAPRFVIRGISIMPRAAVIDGGQSLIATTAQNQLGLWTLADGAPIALIPVDVIPTCMAISADQTMAATGSAINSITISDLKTRSVLGHIQLQQEDSVTDTAFSADGKIVASGHTSGTILYSKVSSFDSDHRVDLGHAGSVTLVTSPDRARLLAITQDHEMFLLGFGTEKPMPLLADPVAGEVVAPKVGTNPFVAPPVFSPDGKAIASGSIDSVTHIWDATTGKQLAALDHHAGPVTAASFSPGGKFLATAGAREIIIWRTSDWKSATTLPMPGVTALAFSGHGQILAAAAKNEVQLWTVPAGKPALKMSEGDTLVYRVFFVPGSQSLVAIGADQNLRVWDCSLDASK